MFVTEITSRNSGAFDNGKKGKRRTRDTSGSEIQALRVC